MIDEDKYFCFVLILGVIAIPLCIIGDASHFDWIEHVVDFMLGLMVAWIWVGIDIICIKNKGTKR